MLWTIAMVLLILWILGFFVVHIGGGKRFTSCS